jgi:hypothetical protein
MVHPVLKYSGTRVLMYLKMMRSRIGSDVLMYGCSGSDALMNWCSDKF